MVITQILDRLKIKYTEEHTQLSAGWVGIEVCPFCKKDNYHMAISKETGAYKCWACGEHGWLRGLLKAFNVSDGDIMVYTTQWNPSYIMRRGKTVVAQVEQPKEKEEVLIRIPGTHPIAPVYLTRMCVYLKTRGLIRSIQGMSDLIKFVNEYNLGVGVGGKWDCRIVAPIETISDDDGNAQPVQIGWCGRAVDDVAEKKHMISYGTDKGDGLLGVSYFLKKAKEINRITKHSENYSNVKIAIPIVEGMFDLLSVAGELDGSEGFLYSLPLGLMGKTVHGNQIELIKILLNEIHDIKPSIIVMMDRGEDIDSGRIVKNLMDGAVPVSSLHPFDWTEVPIHEGKDPNEVIQHHENNSYMLWQIQRQIRESIIYEHSR